MVNIYCQKYCGKTLYDTIQFAKRIFHWGFYTENLKCNSWYNTLEKTCRSLAIDNNILLHLHFHNQCFCSKPTWIPWLIHQLLMLHSTTQPKTSLPVAFVVGPLVLPRDKYLCNTLQLQRCMPTNTQRIKSGMIALSSRIAFLRFYLKCQVKLIIPFSGLEYIVQ